MKLHEAIEKLLANGKPLSTNDIATELNNNKWYVKKDYSLITPFQIHGRTKNYPHLFNRDGVLVSLNIEIAHYKTSIENTIKEFKLKSNFHDRYTSFDYCYNYFRNTTDLLADKEKSCLVLGFYLASWGMFRGSSFLLQKSLKHFQTTIEYISTLEKSVWDIDIDNYNEENISLIIEIYKSIKEILISEDKADLTLVTKILLGVFGFIPAFDQYFCNTFRDIFKNKKCGFRKVNIDSLNCIKHFYKDNKFEIDLIANQTFTKDFNSECDTSINYPKAKIIDMYGFTVGLNKSKI